MKENVIQINDGITINVNVSLKKCLCECKKRYKCKKDYAWNPDM